MTLDDTNIEIYICTQHFIWYFLPFFYLIVNGQYLYDRLCNTTAKDMKDVFISDVVEPLFHSKKNYIDNILSKCKLQERDKFNFETISLYY